MTQSHSDREEHVNFSGPNTRGRCEDDYSQLLSEFLKSQRSFDWKRDDAEAEVDLGWQYLLWPKGPLNTCEELHIVTGSPMQ